MDTKEYSKRLGQISTKQFQAALDHFKLGYFVSAEAIPFGLFGQNVFLKSTEGKFVLRGAAHFDWQFPLEQFVAKLLHEQTDVPVPWPYLVDTDDSIFGWKYGYAIMPRMQGLQLADEKILRAIKSDVRKKIAYAIGENLTEIQKVKWSTAGRFSIETETIKPFDDGFAGWIASETRHWLEKSISYGTGATKSDLEWIDDIINDADEALRIPFIPTLVLRDYKEGNLVVEEEKGRWKVSGVFDLMESIFGDGELDIVRQLIAYMEEDTNLAIAFLAGYRKGSSLRTMASKRLALYVVYDRMIVWEYFHRPEHLDMWWYKEKSPQEWISSYLGNLEEILVRTSA